MQLNAPKKITWWIALIAGVVGVVGSFVGWPVISFWLVVAALALMLLATALSGL